MDRNAPFESALVEFAGVQRNVNMACVPEAVVGDYVLVHAGIAINIVSEREARRLLRTFAELELEDEFPQRGEQSAE